MGWSVSQKYGLTFHRPQLSFVGYTLVSPHSGKSVFLVDMNGQFVHHWRFEHLLIRKVELLDSGNLLAIGVDERLVPSEAPHFDPATGESNEPFEQRIRRIGGNCSMLCEVDWDGKIVWSHEEVAFHHDFKRLANGNVVFPVWKELSQELSDSVAGGSSDSTGPTPPMLGDDVVEIDSAGKEIRRVETWKLFSPENDPICPLEARAEWTHMNSVDVNEAGEILVSCRNNSRVAIIDNSGSMKWSYGAPDTAHQHHASWLSNGNVQIFDNGMHRKQGMSYSRVIEVNPESNEVIWSYQGNPRAQFFSGHISGAVRLPNSNCLITEGTSGRVLEITADGEPVWEWWNPVFNSSANDGESMAFLFRAYRYPQDFPGFAGKELNPESLNELNNQYALI